MLYVRFLWRLPRAIAARIGLAGLNFVGGAIGVELFQGARVDSIQLGPGGRLSLAMELSYLVEETMEMLAVAYLIATLLRYVRDERWSASGCRNDCRYRWDSKAYGPANLPPGASHGRALCDQHFVERGELREP